MQFADYIPYVIGYVYAVIIGHYLVRPNIDALWGVLGIGRKTVRRYPWPSAMLGLLERAMYTTALLIGAKEVLAVWLALKAVPQWKRWSDPIVTGHGEVEGRAVFIVFLIGNALNIAYAFEGYRITEYLQKSEFMLPLVEGLTIVVVSLDLPRFLRPSEMRASRAQHWYSAATWAGVL